MKAVSFETVDDVLKGVGVPEAIHVDDKAPNFALHVRRRATESEIELFKTRKDAGDYSHRLVAKGIV